MAQGNDVVYSQSLTEETTNTQRQRLATGTLTYPLPELPNLPFDLLPEILCRLPVKLLIQLRCLCKFFDSLISDPNFAKKHLHMSTKRRHLMLTELDMLTNDDDDDYYSYELAMHESPISSLFSTSTVVTLTQLYLPGHHVMDVLCCCDGMICGKLKNGSYFLWNPSIRKFKLLPPLENHDCWTSLSFGYDHFVNNYKVVAVSVTKEVCVHTLGTDYWKRIEDIPYYGYCEDGVFVSGTVYWLWLPRDVIISLDLEKESYQMFSLPDYESENVWWTMGVVRDCLSVFARRNMCLDVWIKKEYGNIGTWTKLYSIPHLYDRGLKAFTALYISEDDQLFVKCYNIEGEVGDVNLVVYDTKIGTSNIPQFPNDYENIHAIVYIESLISP
jgi:F-box interacting protein